MIEDELTEAYKDIKERLEQRKNKPGDRRGQQDKKAKSLAKWKAYASTFGVDSKGRAHTGPMPESHLNEKHDFRKNKKAINEMLKSVIEQNPAANKFELEFVDLNYQGVTKPGMRVIARVNARIVDIREMAEK